MVTKLIEQDIEQIVEAENKSFMPQMQANKDTILNRFNKGHTYLGAIKDGQLVGTIAFREAHFVPDFYNFKTRYPTFKKWANEISDSNGNAIFIYSLGVIPEYRNNLNARLLIKEVIKIANSRKKEFLVGDGRIPSYNGSNEEGFENFSQNEELREAVNNHLRDSTAIPRDILSQDPIIKLYMNLFPELKILGVTDSLFIKEDYPAGGHRVMVYVDLRK